MHTSWGVEGSLWCVLFPLATVTGYTSDGGCCCSRNARKRVTLSREHSPPGLGMQHKYKMTHLIPKPWKLLVASSDIFFVWWCSTGTDADESKVERMTCFSRNNPVESFQTHSETAHWGREGGLAIENISDAKHLRCLQCQTGTVVSNQSWGCLQAPPLTCPWLVSLGTGTPVSSLLMCWERAGLSWIILTTAETTLYLETAYRRAQGSRSRRQHWGLWVMWTGCMSSPVALSSSRLSQQVKHSVPVPYPSPFTCLPASNAP